MPAELDSMEVDIDQGLFYAKTLDALEAISAPVGAMAYVGDTPYVKRAITGLWTIPDPASTLWSDPRRPGNEPAAEEPARRTVKRKIKRIRKKA